MGKSAGDRERSGGHQWREQVVRRALEKLLTEWFEENRGVMSAHVAKIFHTKAICFLAFSGTIEVKAITPVMVQGWVNELSRRQLSSSTVRCYKNALSSFMKFCKFRGLISHNPCLDLKLPPKKHTLPRYLTDQQIEQALAYAQEYGIYQEVLTALKTGMRISEIRTMVWENILWEQNLIAVPKSKNRKPRMIPLNSTLAAELKKVKKGKGPVFPNTQGNIGCVTTWVRKIKPLQAAMPQVFTEGTSPKEVGRAWHLFRHTFATRLAMKGVSIYKISKYLGHSSVEITQRYAHYIPQYDEDIENA